MSAEELGRELTTHRRSRVLATERDVSESFLELDWSCSVLGIVMSRLLGGVWEVGVQTRTNLLGLACHRGAGPKGICGEEGAAGENT